MGEKEKQFLADLRSDNAGVRYAAWKKGGEMSPEVIPQLATLIASGSPGVAKAAQEALNSLVHSVGPRTGTPRRRDLQKRLIALAAGTGAKWVRMLALRHLSLVGDEDSVAPVAKLLADAELREEAIFALERIPGESAAAAILAALPTARDDFKPRLLAALGFRRDPSGADACAAAMNSPNPEVSMAAMKALGRIGRKPAKDPTPPSFEGLSEWRKTEFTDSILRFAEAQVKQGRAAEAIKLYKLALDSGTSHLECAAVLGLAKVGTPEAASLILPKLKSGDRTVRITAGKAWDSFKKL